MLPAQAHVFEQMISKPRLDSYRGYFNVGINEAIGLYMWNSELAVCFNNLMAFYEIALRNNVHCAMSQFYSKGTSNSIHWYDTIWSSLTRTIQNKVVEVRYNGPVAQAKLRNPPPSPDEIVSRVSFGFWPNVLGRIDGRFASQIMPQIFPFHPMSATPSEWGIKGNIKKAIAYTHELNKFRNRLAHHEPLWKFEAVMDTSVNPPLTIFPDSKTEADSITRLHRILGFIENGMADMNQDYAQDLARSGSRMKLNYLLGRRGIDRYRKLKHQPDNIHLTPADFRRGFDLIVKNNKPVRVKRSRVSGLFVPD